MRDHDDYSVEIERNSEYVLSGSAGRDVVNRARKLCSRYGRAFIIFIGDILPENAIRACVDLREAKSIARDYAGFEKLCGKHGKQVRLRAINISNGNMY